MAGEPPPRRNGNNSFLSNGSLGLQMDFMSMWSQVTDDTVNRIQTEFCFDIILMTVFVTLLGLAIHYMPGCGIPCREWLIVFVVLYFTRSTF